MPIDLISTPGGTDSNSLCSLEHANLYFERRLPLDPPWITSGDVPKMLLIMATRVLTYMNVARKSLRWDGNKKPYYYTSRAWTGEVSTSTQALVFPRKGLTDRLGRAIADNVVPVEAMDATAELAGQLQIADRTLDNDIIVQGITSIVAGPVELEFKEIIESQVLPSSVQNILPPNWLTDEIITYAVEQVEFYAV